MLRHFFLVEKSEVCNYPWKGVCSLSEERKAHISVLANWYFSAVCLFLLRLQLASNFLLLCIVWLFHSALWLCYWISFKIKCKSGKNEFLSFMKILHTMLKHYLFIHSIFSVLNISSRLNFNTWFCTQWENLFESEGWNFLMSGKLRLEYFPVVPVI